jgi:hypothetical protein
MAKLPGTRLGALRAYFFGFFICTSGFLFGYDTGIVGESRGVLMPSSNSKHASRKTDGSSNDSQAASSP